MKIGAVRGKRNTIDSVGGSRMNHIVEAESEGDDIKYFYDSCHTVSSIFNNRRTVNAICSGGLKYGLESDVSVENSSVKFT